MAADKPKSIVESLIAVMDEVGAVTKDDRNTFHKFNFRGIDAVTNAVSPALRKHGVIVTPKLLDLETSNTASNDGKSMLHAAVKIKYTWRNLGGEEIETVVIGEAADTGDKAITKAHSVAFRIAMLQTLCLPTDETDPDAESYEMKHDKSRPSKPAKPVERMPDNQFKQWITSLNKCQDLDELKKVFGMAWKAATHPQDQQEINETKDLRRQELEQEAAA